MDIETLSVDIVEREKIETAVSAPVVVVIPESGDNNYAELTELRAYKEQRETEDRKALEDRLAEVEGQAALALTLAVSDELEEEEKEEEEPAESEHHEVTPDQVPEREHGFYKAWK